MDFKKITNLVITLLALTGIGFITFFVYTNFINKEGFYVNKSGTAVVKEIQKLNRLETASYTIEKIIDAGTQGTKLQQFLYGDKILLIANGQVIAGFDLAKVNENNVKIEGNKITITMPAPQILVSRLDNEKTRVYDRQQGIFTKGEKDLEAEARNEAELSIRQAACDSGILMTATDNGRKQMTALLSTAGYEVVQIDIPSAMCK